MNFNILFKMKSWQSILTADVDAGFKRATGSPAGERRVSLIDCDASLDHILLSIGPRHDRQLNRVKHLITGASARLTLRTAPDIQLNAGVSNFWQKRRGQPLAPVALSGARRDTELREESAEDR